MSLTTEVKHRIAQGEKAAAGTYIPLIGNKDEAFKLWEAYVSIQDEKYTPEEKPGELTEEQYQNHVRRIHDAVRSTDRAYDAFQTDIHGNTITQQDKQGNTVKTQTGMMNFLDSIKMFELQLVAGKLVTTIHKVQAGKLSIPAWPMLAGLGLHKYKTFPDRMDAAIETLTLWKACCKDLFYTEMTWDKRLAMQPKEEGSKKAANANLNLRRKIAKEEAKKLKEENKKRQAAALGTDEEDNDNDNQNDASKEATPAPTKSAPARKRQRTKPTDFITISARARLGKKVTAESAAEPAANADNATQPVDPPAQAPVNADGTNEAVVPAASMAVNSGGSTQPAASPTPGPSSNGRSTQPSRGTTFVPINAGRSHQRTPSSVPTSNNTGSPKQRATSTPSATMKTATLKQTNNVFAGPAMVDHGPATQAVLAAGSIAQSEFDDTSKFAGPLGNPTTRYGNQGPLEPGQVSLPQQPQRAQSPGQDLPPQYESPGNHVTARQDLSHGSDPGGRGFESFGALYEHYVHGSRGSLGVPSHHLVPQHNQVNESGVHYGQGNQQRGQMTSLLNQGSNGRNPQFTGFTQHGQSVQHGQMARIRLSGPNSYVVNNYYQPHFPEEWVRQDGEFLSAPHEVDQEMGDDEDGDEDQEVNFDEWLHNNPELYLPEHQTVGYRFPVKSGDDQPEDKFQDSQDVTGATTIPTTNQRSRSAAPTVVDEDDPPPQYESALAGSRAAARFDGHEADSQPSHVDCRQRGQVAGSRHGQMPGNTSTTTAPQADPPPETTTVETMNKPEATTTVENMNKPEATTTATATATSTVNLPPWQSHLQGMDPTDAQAFMACSAASLGIPPRLYLDETPVKSAAPRAMFEDDLHDELKEREKGADKAEKSRGAEASKRR